MLYTYGAKLVIQTCHKDMRKLGNEGNIDQNYGLGHLPNTAPVKRVD